MPYGGGKVSDSDLLDAADLDTDGTLAANSDTRVATQKATKTYADTKSPLAGSSSIVTVGTVTSGDTTATVSAASESLAGKVELATTAEINTGTDAGRAMSPDAFQASNRNIRYIVWRAVAVATDTAGSDSTILESMPSPVAGVIQTPKAHNDTAGVTGTAVYDIHLNGTTIMTTTKISILTAQTASTAGGATQPVLTTTAIAVGDVLTFYCDTAQSGTAAKGLTFIVPVLET